MESNPKPIVSLVLFQVPGGQTESKKKRNTHATKPRFYPKHCNIALLVGGCTMFFLGGNCQVFINAKDLEAQCNQNSRLSVEELDDGPVLRFFFARTL